MVPFWVCLLTSLVFKLGPSDLIASIKNAVGKKNANFWRRISNFSGCALFYIKVRKSGEMFVPMKFLILFNSNGYSQGVIRRLKVAGRKL